MPAGSEPLRREVPEHLHAESRRGRWRQCVGRWCRRRECRASMRSVRSGCPPTARAGSQPSPRNWLSSRESGRRRCISADMTVFGDGVGVAARKVGNRNAARGRGRHRDEIEADAMAHDRLEARRVVDDVVGQFRAHDDAVGIRRPSRAASPAAHRGRQSAATCGARIASPSGCMALVRRTIGLSGIGGGPFDDRD